MNWSRWLKLAVMLYDAKIQLGYSPDAAEEVIAEVAGLGYTAARKVRRVYEERMKAPEPIQNEYNNIER